jgi:putative ABC transport system substrate-binding protein
MAENIFSNKASRRSDRMKRRDFIALLGGTTVSWPLAARGQQAIPVIGFLAGGLASAAAGGGLSPRAAATGYVEGQNLHIAFRLAEGH